MGILSALITLRQKMIASAELNAAITGVFDEQAPDDQQAPYIVMGYAHEIQGRLVADSERRGFVRLHIWSDKKGKFEILGIYKLLDAAVTDNMFLFESFEIIPDYESDWTQGVLEYRFYFDKEV